MRKWPIGFTSCLCRAPLAFAQNTLAPIIDHGACHPIGVSEKAEVDARS
jgi:hypothetical protein